MKVELQEALLHRHPKFFRRSAHIRPFDKRGIECEDGWFELIDQLSTACDHEIEALVASELDESHWPRVGQIKEKFGRLRFRVTGAISAKLRELISRVEEVSLCTCEICGKPGRLRNQAGIHTYCDCCQEVYEDSFHKRDGGTSEAAWTAYLKQRELILHMLAARKS